MRNISGFHRKVTLPDLEKRNVILRKLASLKGKPNLQDVKHQLKLLLLETNGSIIYSYRYKNTFYTIAEGGIPKKYLLNFKKSEQLREIIRHTRYLQNLPKLETRSKYIHHDAHRVIYNKKGGVLIQQGFFSSMFKTLKRDLVFRYKTPKTNDSYIGLEIELTSKLSREQVADKLIDMKLENHVRIMSDGSIRITDMNFLHPMEFCILMKFSEIEDVLTRFSKVLADNFLANETCGLHVHLDAREVDYKRMFANLTSMQSVLYSIVEEHRRENGYCRPVRTNNFDLANDNDHYAAISRYSFHKHSTIEVRVHHSTTDMNVVKKWITLLKRIADYRGESLSMGTFESEFTQLKEKVKVDEDVVQYIQECVGI